MKFKNSIRSLIEYFFRNKVFKRVLPTKFGAVQLLVSGEGGLGFLFKKMSDVDPLLISNAEEFVKDGNVVWDVGANLGLFTFTSSIIVGNKGKVIAFEPDAWLVNTLRKSAKRQKHSSNIVIIPTAVAKENAIRTFAIANRARSSNHLIEYGHSQTGGTRESQTVSCVSLDWVLNFYPAPNVLKIDVEGAECEVLIGAQEVIEKYRPIVIVEVGGENSKEVGKFFRLNRYDIYDGEIDYRERISLENAPWTTIAIPK